MRNFRHLALLLSLLVWAPESQAAPIIRQSGAIYLSDFGLDPLKIKILRPAPCYFDLARTRYAGTLRFPQVIQVEALTDEMCRIRGNAQQGGVAAWISYDELEPLPEGLLANLKKSEERRLIVDGLIATNEVAIGMTVEEVGRSLGKPQKTTRRANTEGTREILEFIKYELVPQTTYAPGYNQTIIKNPIQPGGVIVQNTGGYLANTIYVKVPVGTLTVTFEEGLVSALDQTEGNTTGGQVSIVTPPLTRYW